jgi:hypothetical protein
MTLTSKNQSIERNPCPSATLYTIKPTRNSPRLNLGIISSISQGMTPQALCKWYNECTNHTNLYSILDKFGNVDFTLQFDDDKTLPDRTQTD